MIELFECLCEVCIYAWLARFWIWKMFRNGLGVFVFCNYHVLWEEAACVVHWRF